MIGCGGDPRTQLTDEDRAAVAEFRQYLADRRAAENGYTGCLTEDCGQCDRCRDRAQEGPRQ